MTKSIISLFSLGLFLFGMKASAFLPSLHMLKDTQWDFSLFPELGLQKMEAFLLLFPIGLGFGGWVKWIRKVFLGSLQGPIVSLVALSIAVSFFSFYCLTLGLNGILTKYLVGLFFVVGLIPGTLEFKKICNSVFFKWKWELLGWVVLIWVFEYWSPPIIWDAVLDHFRFAQEVARLHQIPFHWTNDTGDMPKFVETLLAGFWTLGGETLSKLLSGIAALLTSYLIWVISRQENFSNRIGQWVFWTCPLFLALFAWGYVEGFLAFFEVLALYCLWKFYEQPKVQLWLYLCAFFLGVAFSIKYTAVFAMVSCDALLIYHNLRNKNWGIRFWPTALLLVLPMAPWVLRNELANGNPIYPLATHWFGGPPGYNVHMESSLLEDTGVPNGFSLWGWCSVLWKSFFTMNNQVGAPWSPLLWMSVPWWGKFLKSRFLIFLTGFALVFLVGWLWFCTSLRHASGGLLVLALIAAIVWDQALKEGDEWVRFTFALGCALSVWLCVCAQLNTTAPYASALGLEDPLKRLARNYSFNMDTYAAYRDIENNSGPWDKVVALGVFQTYPLERTAFVDFYWKKPTLLAWASQCQTAQELAHRFRQEGALFILYQREEAIHSFGRNKNYTLEGMSEKEYIRFWRYFVTPLAEYENSFVYEVRQKPFTRPLLLQEVPGLQEPGFYAIQKSDFKGEKQKAYRLAEEWTAKYPMIAEGWHQRAQMAEEINSVDAYDSALKANRLGLQDISLCQIISWGLLRQGKITKANIWRNLALHRERIENLKINSALAFYRTEMK